MLGEEVEFWPEISKIVTRFGKIHLNAVKLIIRYDHLLSLY